MMRFMAALVVAGLVAASASLEAVERKPLPPFSVTSSTGAVLTNAQLPVPEQWLLIYVSPGCAACDGLLASLKSWQSAQLLQHTILIVGAQPADAQTYITRVLPPEVAAIPWYADNQAQVWNGLHLTGTPVLVGVRKGQVQWAISGVLNDPSSLQSVVTNWVAQ